MSDLSNLYISASYYGVVNLTDSTEPFASQSEGRIYLHDGVGENLGISLDYTKRVSLDNGLTVSGSTLLSGSVDIIGNKTITGSLSVSGNITSGDTISAPSASFDTINARLIHTTIESSSVIYSTGSNTLGDEPSDVQILSGSVYVPNLHYLAGNVKDTNLRIDEKLSTSSFDSFSASLHTEQLQQDTNLTNVSASFAISQGVQDQRLDSIEAFTSSLVADFVTDVEYSASIEVVTSSLYTYIDNQDAKKLNTGSFNTYSSSIQGELNLKSDLTGNNTFVGNNIFSGSVNGNINALTITSNTASMDCSQGNFFTIQLVSGSTSHLEPSNIQPGQTITLKVTQPSVGVGGLSFESNIKFPNLFDYTPTQTVDSIDIVTFVTFDSNEILAVASNNLL